jgi:hypothetical protein
LKFHFSNKFAFANNTKLEKTENWKSFRTKKKEKGSYWANPGQPTRVSQPSESAQEARNSLFPLSLSLPPMAHLLAPSSPTASLSLW